MNEDLVKMVHYSVYCKDRLDFTMLGINKKIDYVISHVSIIDPSIKNNFYSNYKESENLLIVVFAKMDQTFIEAVDNIDIYTSRIIEEMNDNIAEYNDSYDAKLKNTMLHKIEKLMFESTKLISVVFETHKKHIIAEISNSIDIAINDYLRTGHSLTEMDKEVISILKEGLRDEPIADG